MSRVDSVDIAIAKAGDRAKGSVLASDAFFPFPDSIEKAAHSTGIGRAAVRLIPVGDNLAMDVAALTQKIEADIAGGYVPFMLVATAGTINAGVIDPLEEMAEIAERYKLWYHVDAAWAGAAIVSDRLRIYLSGIERADSISCDAH